MPTKKEEVDKRLLFSIFDHKLNCLIADKSQQAYPSNLGSPYDYGEDEIQNKLLKLFHGLCDNQVFAFQIRRWVKQPLVPLAIKFPTIKVASLCAKFKMEHRN